MRNCVALLVVLLACAAAVHGIPQGYSAFFDSDSCPEGWGALNVAQGRLIVSVTNPDDVGITVNNPLSDQEDRVHAHTFSAVISVPQKDIAAIGCCNNQGAQHGDYSVTNNSIAETSGYPFTQLLLCTLLVQNDTNPVAYGAIGYFDPQTGTCPDNWVPMADANGRILVPSYSQGGSVQNSAPSLGSGEDRVHVHNFSINFPTQEVSYAGVDGCCNSGPSSFQELTIATTTEAESTGLPYVQLLTCVNQVPTFNQSMPSNALVFSSISCPPGWEVVDEVNGRMLVALPDGGSPGASFGGNSLPPTGQDNPVHDHGVEGSLTLPSTGVGLASGCCGGGYIGAGTYGYNGATSPNSDMLPYNMVPLCRQSGDNALGSFLKKQSRKK